VKKILVILLAALCAAAIVRADPKETVVTSKKMNFDYKAYVAQFSGDVVVIDPQMRIESDDLTVEFNSTNSVKSVTAVGSVRIKLPDKTATSDKAVYIEKESKIILTGSAKVTVRGGDSVNGDKITIWFKEDRMISEPARLVIMPDEKGGGGGGLMNMLPEDKQPKTH
jgi:lipopolysaccharide transport protein LptA